LNNREILELFLWMPENSVLDFLPASTSRYKAICMYHSKLTGLWQGFNVQPITLEVGDYILTPDVCIERKSVSDLISSFQSGRLYQQAESMCRQFKSPMLLIEFAAGKSFGLIDRSSLPDGVEQSHIISRLCLLVMHFPKLRILWSRCDQPESARRH
jgi:ERCC4-type nuclease